MKRRNVRWPLLAVVTLIAAFHGCSKESAQTDNDEANDVSVSDVTNKTSVVSPSSSMAGTSPAAKDQANLSIHSEPNQVCEAFLNALVAKDQVEAKRMLTRASQLQTSQAELELQPPGSNRATYNVLDPLFATNKKLIAKVECEITDQVDGNTMTYSVTWILRRKKNGWKISGMMLPTGPGNSPDYLSFENPNDVHRIKVAVSGEHDTGTKVADPGSTNLK